jgi:hypothetical protein
MRPVYCPQNTVAERSRVSRGMIALRTHNLDAASAKNKETPAVADLARLMLSIELTAEYGGGSWTTG